MSSVLTAYIVHCNIAVKYYMKKLILFTILLFSFAGVAEAKHKHKHKTVAHKQVIQPETFMTNKKKLRDTFENF